MTSMTNRTWSDAPRRTGQATSAWRTEASSWRIFFLALLVVPGIARANDPDCWLDDGCPPPAWQTDTPKQARPSAPSEAAIPPWPSRPERLVLERHLGELRMERAKVHFTASWVLFGAGLTIGLAGGGMAMYGLIVTTGALFESIAVVPAILFGAKVVFPLASIGSLPGYFLVIGFAMVLVALPINITARLIFDNAQRRREKLDLEIASVDRQLHGLPAVIPGGPSFAF